MCCSLPQHSRVAALRELPLATDAKDYVRQLQVVRLSKDPVLWHMFAKGLLSEDASSGRTATLHQLRMGAVAQHLKCLVKEGDKEGRPQHISLPVLARDVLLTGLPFTPPGPADGSQMWASQRVQKRLWEAVQEVLPEVSCGPDRLPTLLAPASCMRRSSRGDASWGYLSTSSRQTHERAVMTLTSAAV